MKTTLTKKSKFGNSKQSINSTVKLFHQRFKNAQLFESEIRRQISDNLDSEIVFQTFQEFIRNVEQRKNRGGNGPAESSQVLEPLEEAEKLTTMKIEIMQIVKQHEISMRKETSRASSRSSLRSRMSAVSSTSRKNQQKTTGSRHVDNQNNTLLSSKDTAESSGGTKIQTKETETTTTTIGKYNFRNRSIPKLGACTGGEADFDPQTALPSQNVISQDESDNNDVNHLDGSGDHNWTTENPISIVPNNLRNNDVQPNYTRNPVGIYLPSRQKMLQIKTQNCLNSQQQRESYNIFRQKTPEPCLLPKEGRGITEVVASLQESQNVACQLREISTISHANSNAYPQQNLAWDDSLPKEKIKSIQTWIDNYMCSPPIEIPRCLTLDVATRKAYELHVFTDASQLAYGAVAYARIISENGVSCSFLMSKAKVAPIKQLSIQKLELQAAVLGTRLAHFIKKHHTIEFKDTTFWCDSMAVLAWIKNSEKLKVFVGNRVSEIQSQSPTSSWRHISGKSNPADHVSRGILPADIKEHWLSPPAFLFKPKESWSTFLNTEKTNTTMARQTIQPVVAAKNFSKWTKLLKATAQVFRFIEILRTKPKRALNINDVENARNHLIQVSQQNSFGPSIALLNKNKNLPSKDKLLPLSPFLKDNILRVGGRTKRSTLGYNTKHPIVLNAKESIARLFLEKCHEICMHFGTEYVKNFAQQSYYVFGLRDSLRSISYKCFECRRFKGQGLQPPMADLPDARFPENESPVTFTNVGLDYIGPFTVIQRGKEEKAYICLFNCLVTRAVHLEVTEDLTTSA